MEVYSKKIQILRFLKKRMKKIIVTLQYKKIFLPSINLNYFDSCTKENKFISQLTTPKHLLNLINDERINKKVIKSDFNDSSKEEKNLENNISFEEKQ